MGLSLLEDTQGGWPRMPYSFQLGKEFQSLSEALAYMLEHEIEMHGRAGGQGYKEAFAKLLETGKDKANPEWFSRPYFASTEPGGNDAINCYPQFCEDDDIVHPITRASDEPDDGLGRVYSEMIEANQQILWMTFGVAEFNNPVSFYSNAIDAGLAKLMRVGTGSVEDIGSVVGSFVGFVISLPFQPLIWLSKLFNWSKYQSVTKYYDFKQTMLLYYEFANTIMTHFSVNTGMIGTLTEKSSAMKESYENDTTGSRLPKFMNKYGPDIFAIMNMRAKRADPTYNVESLYQATIRASGWRKWWDVFFSNFGPATMGAADYIGLRVEKSVDSSETFTNQSGESSLASTLNGQASSNLDMDANTMGISGGAKAAVASAMDAISMGGGTATLFGTAFIDIPDIWKGSSFGKSYSISLKLVAHYGDTVTIAQSIILPLSLLMAGTLPRATGKNSYTSPFLCRCYCKGKFAIPLGLIENMSITRGDSEFGWNKDNLPTVVTVNLTIKDLSPAMYIALSGTTWTEIFGQNSSFQEYLLTLSGVGLQERILYSKQLKRKFQIWASIKGQTGLLGALFGHGSPSYWSMRTADLGISRTVGAFRRSLSPTN